MNCLVHCGSQSPNDSIGLQRTSKHNYEHNPRSNKSGDSSHTWWSVQKLAQCSSMSKNLLCQLLERCSGLCCKNRRKSTSGMRSKSKSRSITVQVELK